MPSSVPPLQTVDEAIWVFIKLVHSKKQNTPAGLFELMGLEKSRPEHKEERKKWEKHLSTWIKRAQDLTWTSEHFDFLLAIKPDKPSVRSGTRRTPEIMSWVDEPTPATTKALKALLKMGLDPSTFIPAGVVSLLGRAVYAGSVDTLPILLQFCPPPKCRLLLGPEHTTKKTYFGSTVLHRLVDRDFPENGQQIIEFLHTHDPDMILCQTQAGVYADEFCQDPHLQKFVANLRQERQAQVSKGDIQAQLDQLPSQTTTPKKF